MKITNFLVCEFANTEPAGKANLIGAGVDRIYADSFPMTTLLYLYLRCDSEPHDGPGYKRGEIRLMADDGMIWNRPIQMLVTREKPVAVHISSVDFRSTAPGMFRLEFSMQHSRESASWPLEVVLASGPPASAN